MTARVAGSAPGLGVEWLSRSLGLKGGESPFPWQIELLRRFVDGEAVSALDVPTGLGKTATMAIWLVARALGADVPRRLVYVVDRRAVVDQATDVAEALRAWVCEEPAVTDALRLGKGALPISTLRGKHVDNREWLEDPSRPAIVVGTVDMIGSRLLFEAYRCSRRMRPYHAALLGTDALLLLDEAHLVPAFAALLHTATQGESLKAQPNDRHLIPRCLAISLSATGRPTSTALGLDKADFAHDVVARRLGARKSLRIASSVAGDDLAEALAMKAWELRGVAGAPSRVIVFVDSRRTAQAVHDAIEKRRDEPASNVPLAVETVLFVGGRRVAERDGAARRLRKLGVVAGSTERSDGAVFVIATSAGEVGVDLDADHAVLDLVEWERMVQRLGRVNRRGGGAADVWVVPTTLDDKTQAAIEKDEKIRAKAAAADEDADDDEDDAAEDDAESDGGKAPKKLNDDERARVLRWKRREATNRALRSLPLVDDAYDASPRALTQLRDNNAELVAHASTPAPLHPELTRAVLEAWSMTSLEEHTGRPKVWPWLRGWVEEEAQTVVLWRDWLPNSDDGKAFFEAAAVETAETLELESTAVLDWLLKRVKHVAKFEQASRADEPTAEEDVEKSGARRPPLGLDDVALFVLDHTPRAWKLGALASLDKRSRDDLLREIMGSTIVVDTRLGGLDESGLLDATCNNASDVGAAPERALSFRVREVDGLDGNDPAWRVEDTFVSRVNDEGEPIGWLIVETAATEQATTADGRSVGREQSLGEHQAFVERHARRIGKSIGLDPQNLELLALAAALHDEGKQLERWQRAFRAPKERRPLGKTTSRPLQSILAGYRHELGSLPFAERDARVACLSPDDRDLVLHLIAAHHGFARPILRTDGCDDAPPTVLAQRARTIALRFARLEKRWGPWGLAWWETLLRAADQAASRENDERGGNGG